MRLTLIALLALGACTSQPSAAPGNGIAATDVTNILDDASPAPIEKAPIAAEAPVPGSGNPSTEGNAQGAAQPVSAPAADNRSQARFRCMDGVRIVARFDPDRGRAMLVRAGTTIVLPQQRTGSGIRYSDGRTSFAGKGDDMAFSAPGQPPIACTAIR